MKKTTLALAVLSAMSWQSTASAATQEDRFNSLEKRMKHLEHRVKDQDQVIKEKNNEIKSLKESSTGSWFDRIEISGVTEVEANHTSPFSGRDESDIALATAELGIAAQVNDYVSTEIVLLYEEDDTDLEVDVAQIDIGNPESAWSLTAGQFYVPFGQYETAMVSDTLTLEIGEARESSVLVSYASRNFFASAYVFNGTNNENGDNQIDSFGATTGFTLASDKTEFLVSLGYISDLGDSDTLQDAINDNLGSNDVTDQVAGLTAFLAAKIGAVTVSGEYLTTLDEFQTGELAFDGSGAKPKAWAVEASIETSISNRAVSWAIGYQGTDEALALELPERRFLAAVSVEIFENTSFALEWANDDDYSVSDGGTGDDANTITGQLAVSF